MRLGKGSFASVYKVRHRSLGYVRALKVCHNFIEDENDPAWIAFVNECKVLLNIGNGSHPNIVHIYQPRLLENKAMVEMDCVQGDTLHEYIARTPYMRDDEVLAFARQIVGAVAYCHHDVYQFLANPVADNLQPDPADGSKFLISPEKERELVKKYGIVHNDLHSNNIIRRSYDGQYVLLDFGLAIQDSHCVKSSSRFDGAIEYSSPEKLEHGKVSAASDVYALGILLYEVMTGRVPFPLIINDKCSPESARSKVYSAHLHDTPEPVADMRRQAFNRAFPDDTYYDSLPKGFADIVMRCLAKDPSDRFDDAKQLYNAIATLVEEQRQQEYLLKKIQQQEARERKEREKQEQADRLKREAELREKYDRDLQQLRETIEREHLEREQKERLKLEEREREIQRLLETLDKERRDSIEKNKIRDENDLKSRQKHELLMQELMQLKNAVSTPKQPAKTPAKQQPDDDDEIMLEIFDDDISLLID